MAKSSKSQKRTNRELRKIQDAGITAFVLGVFFLVAPLLAGNSKYLKPLADSLPSKLSWIFILIGIGLIGLYALLKKIKPKDNNTDEVKPVKEALQNPANH